jgi:indole-3-glycerol phosphate synthase
VGESIVKQSDPGKGISNLFGKDISVWVDRLIT